LVVGVFASLALVAGIMQGCGGGSGSGDNVSLCQSACDKALSCIPDAGTEAQQAATECKQRCATTVPTTHCSNEAEIVSAARACLQLACDAYQNCSVPACQTTTGTGGNGGTSGGGGTGGSGGRLDLRRDDRRLRLLTGRRRRREQLRGRVHLLRLLHDQRRARLHMRQRERDRLHHPRFGPDGHEGCELPSVTRRAAMAL
jgi:hypothetical protein